MECERVIPRDVLDDLCSRFIINVPDEERRDLIRICFQIESAHWFYLDFYSKNFPTKKPCGIREFAQQIFKHLPFLQPYASNVEKIIDEWKDYKFCVPTFGAILLDEDLSHVLLVQSYCSRSSWGFPKGKVNKDEPPYQCAIREVYEETGFDISHLINTNEYIEANVHDQVVRLYIIPGIDKNEKFEPKTRNEIKAVNWFPIYDIPINKKEATLKLGTSANTFFLVSPFLRRLRQWIFDHNQRFPAKHFRRQRHKSCSDIDGIRYKASTLNLNLKESMAMLKNLKDKRGDITNKDSAKPCEVDPVKDDEKKKEKVYILKSDCNEPLDSQLNCTRSDGFNQTYFVGQSSLEHSPKKNFSFSTELAKTVVVVRNDLQLVYDSDRMITKKGIAFANTSSDNVNQVTCSSSSKGPLKQNVDILSNESAFRKVEKSGKNKKRRGKKVIKSMKCDDSHLGSSDCNRENSKIFSKECFCDIKENSKINSNECASDIKEISKSDCDLIEPASNEQDSIFEPFNFVSSWVNFKFDLNEIVKSMDDAAPSKKKE